MDAEIRKELFGVYEKSDALFRKLVAETEREVDDNKYAMNVALISLVIQGKMEISQRFDGELLFTHCKPN
jgi:hypothetical protein